MDRQHLANERASAELERWRARLERISAHTRRLGCPATRARGDILRMLENRTSELWLRLHELRRSSPEGWTQARQRLEQAWREARAVIERAARSRGNLWKTDDGKRNSEEERPKSEGRGLKREA